MAFYLIVLVTVLTQISYKGSKVLISLYAIELGANPFTNGLLFAMYAVFPALLAVYAGRVSDRFGFRAPMLSYSMLVAALTCLALPFLGIVPLLMLAAFVYGLGSGCCGPLSMILAYNRAPPGRSGEAIGMRQTVNKLTEVVMPVLFGSVGAALGVAPVFWGTALLLSGGAALMRREHGS